MHMHSTIKNNHNYTHIWVLIILSARITHFLSHRDIYEFYFFLFLFLDIQNEITFFFNWIFDFLIFFILDSLSFVQH